MTTEVSSPIDEVCLLSVEDVSSLSSPSLSPTEEFIMHAIQGKLSLRRFIRRCSGIRNLLLSHTLDINELQQIWGSVLGDVDTCDLNGFIAMNIAIEEYLQYRAIRIPQSDVIILRASDIAACIGTTNKLPFID